MKAFRKASATPPNGLSGPDHLIQIYAARGEAITRQDALAEWNQLKQQKLYVNDVYQVLVKDFDSTPLGRMRWLSVKRLDGTAVRDWRDMQYIKNHLAGQEYEGVELYPCEDRLVDEANQFHIWVVMEQGFRFPFGYSDRHVSDESGQGVSQRSGAGKAGSSGVGRS